MAVLKKQFHSLFKFLKLLNLLGHDIYKSTLVEWHLIIPHHSNQVLIQLQVFSDFKEAYMIKLMLLPF